ncbi:replication protein [Candidatus Woesearchaeota archaeon]|nr:replication protein [Candidatus Woesearchaeota archaeon]
MIPNTTQVPNSLFNGEMKKMKDTELRIVLIVTRKTLGWIENPETGMRKEEDWISHNQLKKLTGRTSRSLSTAIDNCIKEKWIEARDKNGNVLDTKDKRAGKKIFYRLGKIFLKRVNTTSEKSKEG